MRNSFTKQALFIMYLFLYPVGCFKHTLPKVSSSYKPTPTVWVTHDGSYTGPLEPFCTPQKITLIEFMASWCEACQFFDASWKKMGAKTDAVALVKYNIGDWESPGVAKHMQKASRIPFFIAYSPTCKLLGTLEASDADGVLKWTKELQKRSSL